MEDIAVAIVVYELGVVYVMCTRYNQIYNTSPCAPKVDREYAKVLATIAHQLQTPLVIMHGELELLCRRLGSPSECEVLQRSLGRMTDCIDAYLHLARIEHARELYRLQACDISTIVRLQVEYIEVMGLEQGVVVTSYIQDGVVQYVDRALVQELILIIAHNAIKYRCHTRESMVHITLAIINNRAILTVTDNGIGIALQDRERVFQEFYRGSNGGVVKGNGLGLAIAQKIVDLHGARIEIVSVEGEGTTVSVVFPAKPLP